MPGAATSHISPHRTRLLPPILRVLLVASVGGWVSGCGVQGTPHPPRLERPAMITNLSVVQVGQSLAIQFTLPQQTTEGGRLTKPLEVEILRALAPEGAGVAKLPEPEVWTRLVRNEWLPFAKGNEVLYPAHLSEREFHDWRGHTLVVGIRTLTRGFNRRPLESDPSNFVDVNIYDVSPALAGVHCTVSESAIEIDFPPPTRALDGEQIHDLVGYRVYRSPTGVPGTFLLQGEAATPPYRDRHFEFGKTYYYEVRAVFGTPGHLAMSDPSPAVEVSARDVFPPSPPQGLSSIYSAGAVELLWTANTESDLAGYNVYRLQDHNPERVNKELVRTSVFRDATAPPGQSLIYYVTAVDLSGNESKGSEKVEVETK